MASPARSPGPSPFQIAGVPTLGAVCFGAMVVCLASGVVLMSGFEPSRAVASTLAFEIGRPYGWFFRALHAWSAHLFLVTLVAHTVDYVVRCADRQSSLGTWLAVVGSLPVTVYLMLGGRALAGDAEGQGVAAVLHGIAAEVAVVGEGLADLLVGATPGGDPHILLTHHAVTGVLLLVAATVVHLRRVVPDAASLGVALGLSGLIAIVARPALSAVSEGGRLRGPWFMAGLRLGLEHVPAWLAGIVLPCLVLSALALLPAASDSTARRMRVVLGVAGVAYATLSLVATWL